MPSLHKGYKSYFIYDNYSFPYLVYSKPKGDVYIYEREPDADLSENAQLKDMKVYYTTLVRHIVAPNKVFVGKSPKMPMTEFSGGIGSKFDGNTILVHEKGNQYIMIDGTGANEFTTDDDVIMKYYSPLGNNQVPYQFAKGKKYWYFWTHPEGYMSLDALPTATPHNLQVILDTAVEYAPFMHDMHTHALSHKDISLEEFQKIQQTQLADITMSTLKKLAIMFSVTSSAGSKKALADRIEQVRGITVYAK